MRNPEEALNAASTAAPAEACGVTVGGLALVLRNVSDRPLVTFEVDPYDLEEALLSSDGAWDGVWHSHPDGSVLPSDEDVRWHPRGKALYIVARGKVFEYDHDGTFVRVHRG